MTLTLLAYYDLYTPPDVEQAILAWDANCGPAALAAILRQPLAAVRSLLAGFPRRGYMNPTQMLAALELAHCTVSHVQRGVGQPWPSYGLGFVQWHGPWMDPGRPVAAAYRRTHWIGLAETSTYGRMVYDINCWDINDQRGDWVPVAWWEQEIVPMITAEISRATCDWHLRWTCAVSLPTRQRHRELARVEASAQTKTVGQTNAGRPWSGLRRRIDAPENNSKRRTPYAHE
jgi:hypothetical protein